MFPRWAKFFWCIAILTSASGANAESDKVRVGAMLCQTGNCADWGGAALKGAKLAMSAINREGGILGKKVEIVVEDTAEATSGAAAVTAFQALLAKDIRFFIGPSWSPGALAISPVAKKRSGIVIITPSASASEFSRSAPYIFNVRPPEEIQSRTLARYAFANGKRRAAIFTSQQPAEQTQGRFFEDEFKKLGGTITAFVEPIPTSTNLKSEALTIVRSKPDVVFLMNYNQIETGIKELNTLHYAGWRMAIALDDARVAAGKGLFEDVVIGRAVEPSAEFKNLFQSEYHEPPGLSAEGGFIAMMMLKKAISEAGSFDSTEVAQRIQNGAYDGPIGEFTFNADREINQEPALFRVRDGRCTPIQ